MYVHAPPFFYVVVISTLLYLDSHFYVNNVAIDSWNVYHVVGLCLMILSFIVWAFDIKTYLDKKNKFL